MMPLRQLPHLFYPQAVVISTTMREIHPNHINAGFNNFLQHTWSIGGWAQGGDYFSASFQSYSLIDKNRAFMIYDVYNRELALN